MIFTMGEPRRWKFGIRNMRGSGGPVGSGSPRMVLLSGPEWKGDCDVREDQATEADREKIARRLAEYAAHELGLEIEVLDHHFETADELLALIFGDEQQRVEAEAQSREP
jgi:hypothetical protein